ncbi:triacylglycerol lipase [Infundibulicybe gibba]|nr:triacylglycerol lipase [Infundibulicybe gibba]
MASSITLSWPVQASFIHLFSTALFGIALIPVFRWAVYQCRPSASPASRGIRNSSSDMSIAQRIQKAKNFSELCAIFGYESEEHTAQTADGYLLGLHRLPCKTGESISDHAPRKPVVYLHHGLLTNSELFVCLTDAQRCLPFVLVENGYDVWLGNNRGNKYSQRHTEYDANSSKFWDFSIDHFARYDIPDSIDFILKYTQSEKLSYIGFSQGTAQAFAALSIHPELNKRIKVFVALAPIMRPAGFATGALNALVNYSPALIFKFFGRKSMLSSVAMWQSVLPQPILRRVIDTSLVYLFNYRSHNITPEQKVAAYAHIYCFSSVKAVVHWFQIMRNSAFHMYDQEDVVSRVARSAGTSHLEQFPTRDIVTPMVLLYGDRDILVDMDVITGQLPQNFLPTKLDNYEHLDILWGENVHIDVIPKVLEAINKYHTPRE